MIIDQRITGRESVRYSNQSPHTLKYIWFQLDQNLYRNDSEGLLGAPAPSLRDRVPFTLLRSVLARESFPGVSIFRRSQTRMVNCCPL